MLNGFLEKRIGGFFATDGGGGAMTGVDDGVGRQGEDLFSDAGQEQIAVSSRKIPAADAIREKDIAAKKAARSRKIEAEAARAVTGDEQQLGAQADGTGPESSSNRVASIGRRLWGRPKASMESGCWQRKAVSG